MGSGSGKHSPVPPEGRSEEGNRTRSSSSTSGQTQGSPTKPGQKKLEFGVPKMSSLAARRHSQDLVIKLKKPITFSVVKVGGLKGLTVRTEKPSKRSIRWTDQFATLYNLHGEVMPSCHSGMEVLNATRRSDNAEVVVKVRHKSKSFRSKGEEKEWRASTELVLNLPVTDTIAQLYEVIEDKKAYYVVMEKVHGLDLFETLHGTGPLRLPEIKEVLVQLLTALAQLHARGAIHRDVKLENVMVERSPVPRRRKSIPNIAGPEEDVPATEEPMVSVKLIDFDTVEDYEPQTPKIAKDVLGTDQYISHEAYDGQYSPASDVFAVGVIGYKLLTGRFPFDNRIFNDDPGENWVGSPKMKEIREKLHNYDIDWSHRVFENQPAARDLLTRMLAGNAEERPTAQEALSNEWLQFHRSPRQEPKRLPTPLATCDEIRPTPCCIQEVSALPSPPPSSGGCGEPLVVLTPPNCISEPDMEGC